MDLLVTVAIGEKKRRIAWVSLQPDGSVSVGLSDKTFVAPDFKAQNFVWSANNRETLHYLVSSDPGSLRPIRNPHLTFHPPHDFHLKADGGHMLFEGIGDLGLMLRQDGIVPWIRFVSSAVGVLRDAGSPRNPKRAEELIIQASRGDCSIAFGVDFVAREVGTSPASVLLSRCLSWQGYWLHLHAIAVPAQIATLSWFHQR